MAGGSGGDKTTTTQKTEPWGPQQEYLLQQYSNAQNLLNNYAPQYYPGSTVAGMSPYTQTGAAQLGAFGSSPYFQNLVSQGQGSMGTLQQAQSPWTNPVLGMGYGQMGNIDSYMRDTLQGGNSYNPQNANAGQVLANYQQMQGPMSGNPYLDAAVDAAQKRTAQNFNEQVMPQISMSSVANNAFGGSRQGIAEGLAADRLQQQMGDIATQMYTGAYESGQNRALQGAGTQAGLTTNVNLANANQGLQAAQLNQQGQQFAAGLGTQYLQGGMNNSLDAARLSGALAPQMAQLGLMPAQTNLQAGQIEQGYNQQVLDDNVAAWNFYQNLPWQMQQQYANLIAGNVGQSGQTTGSGGTSTSPLLGAIGGATTGLGAASMLWNTPWTGAVGGPAALVTALALAGGLSNM